MDRSIKSNIGQINPEPLGAYVLPPEKHQLYKRLLLSICKNAPIEFRQPSTDGEPFTDRVCHNSNQNLLNDFDELNDLKKDLQSITLNFIHQLGYLSDQVVINDCWLNVTNKGAILPTHFHANSYISGNYFVNYDPQVDTRLQFLNDRYDRSAAPVIQLKRDPNNNTAYNMPSLNINAMEGQILVWRSQLAHGFKKPNERNNRVTLSFNSMPKICTNGTGNYSFVVEG